MLAALSVKDLRRQAVGVTRSGRSRQVGAHVDRCCGNRCRGQVGDVQDRERAQHVCLLHSAVIVDWPTHQSEATRVDEVTFLVWAELAGSSEEDVT